MIVSRYTADDTTLWNDFNKSARNSHILFDRGFMDYHSARFDDWSLIIRDDEVSALLPANRIDNVLHSHQGLTFGGLILSDKASAARILAIFDAIIDYLVTENITLLYYKAIPSIYHSRPASEDEYGLFRVGAQLIRRDLSTTIDFRQRGPISSRRIRGSKKASRHGVTFGESGGWNDFWDMLSTTLAERHGVAPVHSVSEMVLLATRFPDAIRLFVASENGALVAGTVIFSTPTVAHAQYIAASSRGRQIGALDGLFEFVIAQYRDTKRYFDFGISTEDGGRKLNEGLLAQKEEFGGSSIVHDIYELRL